MDKKKLFKFLDVALLLIFLVPVIIPHITDPYLNIWTVIIIFFALVAYYAIRSEITKEPFWGISWKRSLVSLICLIALFLIDIAINRFWHYPSLVAFEYLTANMVGEIYVTYFAKTRV